MPSDTTGSGDRGNRTLGDVAPELADYVAAGLQQLGRHDFAAEVDRLPIYDLHYSSSHVWMATVRGLDVSEVMSDPRRERIWLGRPRGVRKRQWAISLEIIENRVVAIAVSYPGILRPTFEALAREMSRQTPMRART